MHLKSNSYSTNRYRIIAQSVLTTSNNVHVDNVMVENSKTLVRTENMTEIQPTDGPT